MFGTSVTFIFSPTVTPQTTSITEFLKLLQNLVDKTRVSYSCVKHPMTAGDNICGRCANQHCSDCVVFPYGASGTAICIACALELGGVQRQHGGPKISRQALRKRMAAHQVEQAEQAVASSSAELTPSDLFLWLDDAHEATDLPGGWKQSYLP